MKTTKILYWVCTVPLLAMMLFSAYSSFFPNPDGIAMMKMLGYPFNVLVLLAVAKILGTIALLVPGFPRLKEWAYAGFTFDLIGATYAMYKAGVPFANWAMMLLFLLFVAGSYICYHKLKDAKTA